MKRFTNATLSMTTLTSAMLAVAFLAAGCEPGAGADSNGDGIPDEQQTTATTGEATGSEGEAKDECADGACYGALELIDDLNNPTLAPTCDAGPPRSPGADIDGAVLVDEDGVVFATLGSCEWKQLPSTCKNDHADLSAAEGSVTLLDDSAPTNLYDPKSRQANFAPAETQSGDYVALNGGSMQCEWVDLASGRGTYAKPTDTIWVYEVGGGNGTKTEKFQMRLCNEKGGACNKETGFGAGVSFVPVKYMM